MGLNVARRGGYPPKLMPLKRPPRIDPAPGSFRIGDRTPILLEAMHVLERLNDRELKLVNHVLDDIIEQARR